MVVTRIMIFSVVLLCLVMGCARAYDESASTIPIDHTLWHEILAEHVSEDGWVNYSGISADLSKLDEYLSNLSQNPPSTSWTRDEKLAFWINAYNAFTIKLIMDHYPVHGIKEIKRGIPFVNSVWDIKFIVIGGQKIDLNYIEHGILRKEFDEPRIHFAINCASVSCPVLRNEAYRAEILEEQLSDAAKTFLSDPTKNKISKDEIKISKIFKWFRRDFVKNRELTDFLNLYSSIKIDNGAKVKYLKYNWSLNDGSGT